MSHLRVLCCSDCAGDLIKNQVPGGGKWQIWCWENDARVFALSEAYVKRNFICILAVSESYQATLF